MKNILKIIDSNKKAVAFLNNIESGSVKQVVNGEYVLNFIALIEPLKTEFLYDDTNLIEYNNDYFKVISIEEEHNSDNILKVFIECEHISYDLIKQTKLSYTQTDRAAIYVMNDLLLNSGFNFIGTDVVTTASIDIQDETNIKNLLYQVAIIWQGELKYFQNDIELKQQLGKNRGADFRFGKNIKAIKRFNDKVENIVSYEVEIVQGSELEELGYFELGDTIRVVDEMLNIEIEIRIIETATDLVTGLNSKVVLGQPIKDLSTGFSGIFDTINKTKLIALNANDKVKEIVDEHGNLIASKLTGTLNSAIETVEGQTGYVTFDQRGIVIHNQPIESESTWAILLSSGGILLANAKESDGSWRWRTAVTGDSISADEITTGTLTAININGVNITGSNITGSNIVSENGTYRTEIKDGKLIIKDTTLVNDGLQIGYRNFNNRGYATIIGDVNDSFLLSTASDDMMGGDIVFSLDVYDDGVGYQLIEQEMIWRGSSGTYGPWGEFNITFDSGSYVAKNAFNVRNGSKNAIIETQEFGDLSFSAYEMSKVILGTMGESEVINGECIINLEPKFLACVNTLIPYQVFLQPYGNGNIYVEQRNATNFIVKGDNIKFGYEIKANRKQFEDYNYGFPEVV